MRFLVYLAAVGLILIVPGTVLATTVTFMGFDGTGRIAFADFTQNGNTLTVTLRNKGSSSVTGGADVLTALFYTIDGLPRLSAVTAQVPGQNAANPDLTARPDSHILHYTASSQWIAGDATAMAQILSGNVSGEWAYNENVNHTIGVGTVPVKYGISSSGLGDFGRDMLFAGGVNLDNPVCPDGPNYGIVSWRAGLSLTPETPLTAGSVRSVPLIQDTVTFTLTGLPDAFQIKTDGVSHVYNVWFQYGTGYAEPSFGGILINGQEQPPIPEPLTLAGVLLAVGGLASYVRRRRRV